MPDQFVHALYFSFVCVCVCVCVCVLAVLVYLLFSYSAPKKMLLSSALGLLTESLSCSQGFRSADSSLGDTKVY